MKKGAKGKKNGNWNGGTSEYLNHYEMKKNRLIKLKQTKAKCEVCGKKANCIHHKDFSHDNHNLKNLIILCDSCHGIIHNIEHKPHQSNYKPTSKYIRIYGMTLKQIAEKYGGYPDRYLRMHKQKKLKEFLNTP